MIKYGIHSAYAAKDWTVDNAQVIRRVAAMGFDVLEANPGLYHAMGKHERQELKKLAADLGLELTFSFGFQPQYDISSPDESVRQNGIRYCKEILQTIAEMGGHMLGGCVYSYWPYAYTKDTPDREMLTDISVKSVKECIKVAEDNDIDYAVEVLNRFEQVILNTAAEGVAYCKRVGSPRAKLVLDTFHMNIEEDSFEDGFRTAGDYLDDIHFNENNRKFPGMGFLPWESMMQTLVDMNYGGLIVLEPFMVAGGQVGRDIYLWRDLTNGASQSEMDVMAKRSLEYLRGLEKAAG